LPININITNSEANTKELKGTGAPKELIEISSKMTSMVKEIEELNSSIHKMASGLSSGSGGSSKEMQGVLVGLGKRTSALEKMSVDFTELAQLSPKVSPTIIQKTTNTIEKVVTESKSGPTVSTPSGPVKLDIGDTAAQIERKVSGAIVMGFDKGIKNLKDTLSSTQSTDKSSLAALTSAISATKAYTIQPTTTKVQSTPDNRLLQQTVSRIDSLNSSLLSLQKTMYEGVQQAIKPAGRKAEILPAQGQPTPFKLAKGAREWELQIVNMEKLRESARKAASLLNELPRGVTKERINKSNAAELKDVFKQLFVAFRTQQTESKPATVISDIESWLSETNVYKGANDVVAEIHKAFKKGETGAISGRASKEEIADIYANIVLPEQALRKFKNDFVKSITIPAIRATKQGNLEFETSTGSAKTASYFGNLNTGLERLLKTATELGTASRRDYKQEIEGTPLRPGVRKAGQSAKNFTDTMNTVNALAESLIRDVSGTRSDKGNKLLQEGYSKAIRGRVSKQYSVEDAASKLKEFKLGDTKLLPGLDELQKTASAVGISFYDVAKALNSIEFSNFYEELNKAYKTPDTGIKSKLGDISNIHQANKSFRQVSKVKDELLEYMPQIQAGLPKRSAYNQEVIALRTRGIPKKLMI